MIDEFSIVAVIDQIYWILVQFLAVFYVLDNRKKKTCFIVVLDYLFQDLKNLREQLYSAAEYFELSYAKDDQKHM